MYDSIANFTGAGHATAFPTIDSIQSEVKYATAWISDVICVVRTYSTLFIFSSGKERQFPRNEELRDIGTLISIGNACMENAVIP